jgi:predicted TIM-barrel fold metal-dependent hydrolase
MTTTTVEQAMDDSASSTMKGVTRRDVLAAGAALALGRAGAGQAAAGGEEVIDIHAHILTRDTQRYPSTPLAGNQSDWSKERSQTFEQYVAEANAAGVSKAAIVQVSTYYGVDDSYLVDSVSREPRRFTGVCSINTLAPDAVQVLDGWMRRGASGLRIFTGGLDKDLLVDPRAAAVWEHAVARGFTLCISTQAAGMPHVRTLLQRYPQVKVVLDHGSVIASEDGPPYAAAESFFELARFRNFYLKITPVTFALSRKGKSTPDAFFPKLVSVFGADHIAFGSNLPSTAGPLTRLVADAKTCLAALSPADRAMVRAGTAKRLYPALA